MKVGTRITAATSALVAVTLGLYALFELRSNAKSRRVDLERDAREVTLTVRAMLESQGIERVLGDPGPVEDELNRSGTPWRVVLLPRNLVHGPDGGSRAQLKRLRTIIDAPDLHLTTEEGEDFVYTVPLRVPALTASGFRVAGALEVRRSTAHLDEAFRADLARSLSVLIIISGLTILASVWLTRSLMSRPIDKLLEGVDDVAQGDLSRVVLSERDDEIGALAQRFNEMTFSLRESRAETERQHDAKMALEQRLSHSEKLATIGQLAAEIAHEVGTPLNVIAGRARGLEKKATQPEAVRKNAGIIAEQTARITRIIQRLLDFARRKVGAAEPQEVNLNEVTLTTMEFLEVQFTRARVSTTLARAEGLPRVRGHSDQLHQVILNLLLNAIEAMPRGGTLRVETSVVTRRRPGLERAPEQKYVVLEVTDSGEGVPDEMRDKIFEPFYTSKQDSGGTGLGLAVCAGLVKDHDGWLEVDDAPTGGAIFRVFLPAA